METKFQTSFIPKKTVVEGITRKPSVGLFLLIAIILFIVSLSVAGWVYLEKKVLITKINNEKTAIETNKNNFETATIESIIRLDSRIKVANDLVKNHLSVSPIFNFIESRTLKNVRFKSFTFSSKGTDSSGNPVLKIDLSGQAKDFKTLALQADEFGKTEYRGVIEGPMFSSLNLAVDGSVNFNFSASVVPDFAKYENSTNFQQ
jgi:hypothetical protein